MTIDDYNLCNCCVIVSRFKGQPFDHTGTNGLGRNGIFAFEILQDATGLFSFDANLLFQVEVRLWIKYK